MNTLPTLTMMLLLPSLLGQITVKWTPEDSTVPQAVIATAHNMRRYEMEACNDGASAVTLPRERLSFSAPSLRFIDPDDAMLVLLANQRRTVAGTIARVGSLAAQGLAIGLAFANGRSNAAWSVGLSAAGAVIPQVIQTATQQVPSVTSLASAVKYPYVLASGGCFTDHWFASKTRKPPTLVTSINLAVSLAHSAAAVLECSENSVCRVTAQ